MRRAIVVLAAGAAMLASACGAERSPSSSAPSPTTLETTSTVARDSAATSTSTASTRPIVSPTAPPGPVTIRYRLERRTIDDATAEFTAVVETTLGDSRGWERAGFRFVRDDAAPYRIVLAEGDEVDQLCLPYDTYGRYSCQNGPVVALNADRWRNADPKWTGDLPTYRQMLVNHEVGHLLGQRHPRPQCPRAGRPAPVMNQQSTELNGCLPNPWPLAWEIQLAARHDRPLAPPPDR